MKKLFITLFPLGVMTASFAQAGNSNRNYDRNTSWSNKLHNWEKEDRSQEDARSVILERDQDNRSTTSRHQDDYQYKSREKEETMLRINHLYQEKINAVKHNRRLFSAQKSRQIRSLETERQEKIKQVEKAYDYNRKSNA